MPCHSNKLEDIVMVVSGCRLLSAAPLQNLTGFALDGDGRSGAPSTRREGPSLSI